MLSFTRCCTLVRYGLTNDFLAKIVTRIFIAVSLALGLSACASLPDNCYSSDPHAGLVVFGDSYSDTGNLMVDLPSPFFGARISNGRLAVEHLADDLGTQADPSFHPVGCRAGYNYAVVGGNVRGSADEDLLCQVNEYLQRTDGDANADALYFVMMGGNDVRQLNVNLTDADRDAELDSILDVLFEQLQRLVDAGVMKLMVANSGDMGRLPGSIASGGLPPPPHALTTFSEKYNELFDDRFGDFKLVSEAAHLGLEITKFDLFSEMAVILDNPTWPQHQFVNSTDACFDVEAVPQYHSSCSAPTIDSFVFFDSVHATSRTHEIIAEKIIAAIPPPP